MKVTLIRRWGPHRAGNTCEVSDTQGAWLIQHSYAEGGPDQAAAAPGGNGPDPLAGGDATRLRPRIPRSEGSTASPAPGSSPTYRPGFDAEASRRQGVVGRSAPEPATEDSKKPAKRRSKSEA
jgi:hypothetical protein